MTTPSVSSESSALTISEACYWLKWLRITSILCLGLAVSIGTLIGMQMNPVFIDPAGLSFFGSFVGFLYVILSITYFTRRSIWEGIVSSIFLPLSILWMYPRYAKPLKQIILTGTLPATSADATSLQYWPWLITKRNRFFAAIALGILVMIIGYVRTIPTIREQHLNRAADTGIGQHVYTSPNDAFSVNFPLIPEITHQTSTDGLTRNQYASKDAEQNLYAIWVQPVSAEVLAQATTPAAQQKLAREGLTSYETRTDGVKLETSQDTFFQGHPAVYFTLSENNIVFAGGYAFLAYEHYYTLLVSAPQGLAYNTAVGQSFFNSFTAAAP
jgi:hypothetical protein